MAELWRLLRNPWLWGIGQAVGAAFLLRGAPEWAVGLALAMGSGVSFIQALMEKHMSEKPHD